MGVTLFHSTWSSTISDINKKDGGGGPELISIIMTLRVNKLLCEHPLAVATLVQS